MWESGTGEERPVIVLARTAIANGLEALAVNDLRVALRWLERAHRLVPLDPNATLALASACLAHDPARAALLFQSVADKHDVRQAWVGLAAARFKVDGPEAAEQPLANVLSRHAFAPDIAVLVNAVALRPGSSGWCALKSDCQLLIQALVPAKVRVRVDEIAIHGTKLPAGWNSLRTIDARVGDIPLLGSPIDIGAIRRVTGCVEAYEGGIRGWAWHPADPETPPVLTIRYSSDNRCRTIVPLDESIMVPDTGPLARPRSFSLTRTDLPDTAGLIHIQGPDGKDLLGSPLDPLVHKKLQAVESSRRGYEDPTTQPNPTTAARVGLTANELMPRQIPGAAGRRRKTTIVILVHDGGEVVPACLTGVLASVSPHTRIVVVDDASSQPTLIEALSNWAGQRKILLLLHRRPMGFPASANAGIVAAGQDDVVLLNSATLVPPEWIERLRAAAYARPDIGTVTPLSNNASILSYPGGGASTTRPNQSTTNRLDRLTARANGSHIVDIPSGIGFCLYLRRDCLNMVGSFRADLFAQGYGEDTDFCLRARHLGWRNVGLTGLFVGHVGGTSFGGAATHLRARNSRIIEQCHPGHDALIDRFLKADPVANARRRIDRLIWDERTSNTRPAAILITHNNGGGVEQRLAHAAARHADAGRQAIILRPAETARGDIAISVHDGVTDDLPNLVYTMPQEFPALVALLRTARPEMIEAHHLAGHPPAIYDLIAELRLPYTVHVHDYAWFCPRVSLLGSLDRYCGEPDLSGCETCVVSNGHFLSENITVSALQKRSAAFLAAARQVVVPSDDTGIRIGRHFSELMTVTVPHEDDALIPRTTDPSHAVNGPTAHDGRPSVCVPGAIGLHKGFDVLLACAQDAAHRDLDLEFIVVGHTINDARIMATGRVFVTGQFKPHDAVPLIAAQRASLGFIPSICPETWCLSLGDIWRAGLYAAAFDIGAPAERIRRYGQGILLPLGLSALDINNTLITAIRTSRSRQEAQ